MVSDTEDQKPIFTLAGDSNFTSTTESFQFPGSRIVGNPGMMSSMTTIMHGFGGSELLNMLNPQEPDVADSAPSVADMEELLANMRINGSNVFTDDASVQNNYFSEYSSRSESAMSNIWLDDSNVQNSRIEDMPNTFDFLFKSLKSANNYVSMLTREQLSVLRSIRPTALHEFLLEVARARNDRRMRRALPNECAFCKNNGENEECYATHTLKDWRGRVLCPVLRAFHCPRCGATGERAHTIKYCPESIEPGSAGLASRRRAPPSTLLFQHGAGVARWQGGTAAPSASPVTSPASTPYSYSSLWSNLGQN